MVVKKILVMVLMILTMSAMCKISIAEEYLNVNIAKLASPAFTEELSNKKIVIAPTFIMTSPMMLDLPSEYRTDYIRISAGEGSNLFMNVLVPKRLSDQAYNVAQMDVISQRASNVKIYGQTLPMVQRRVLGDGQQGSLLLIVDKIELSASKTSDAKEDSTQVTLDIPTSLVEKLLITASKKGSTSLEEVIMTILKEKYE